MLLFFLLQIDTLSQPAHTISLPDPPVGGSKQDWIGYAITVGVTALIGIITRAFEKRRDKRKWRTDVSLKKEGEKENG